MELVLAAQKQKRIPRRKMGFVGIAVFCMSQSYLSSLQTLSSSSVKQASSARSDSVSVPYKHCLKMLIPDRWRKTTVHMFICRRKKSPRSSLLGTFSPNIQLYLHSVISHIIHPQQLPHPSWATCLKPCWRRAVTLELCRRDKKKNLL